MSSEERLSSRRDLTAAIGTRGAGRVPTLAERVRAEAEANREASAAVRALSTGLVRQSRFLHAELARTVQRSAELREGMQQRGTAALPRRFGAPSS